MEVHSSIAYFYLVYNFTTFNKISCAQRSVMSTVLCIFNVHITNFNISNVWFEYNMKLLFLCGCSAVHVVLLHFSWTFCLLHCCVLIQVLMFFRLCICPSGRSHLTARQSYQSVSLLLSRSLAGVLDHSFGAVLTFHFTAPVKFTLALRHLREVVGIVSAFTTQVRAAAWTYRGFLADAILRSRDSQTQVSGTIHVRDIQIH